jgi:hypothetical protein
MVLPGRGNAECLQRAILACSRHATDLTTSCIFPAHNSACDTSGVISDPQPHSPALRAKLEKIGQKSCGGESRQFWLSERDGEIRVFPHFSAKRTAPAEIRHVPTLLRVKHNVLFSLSNTTGDHGCAVSVQGRAATSSGLSCVTPPSTANPSARLYKPSSRL